jgi:hypothetical protein
MSRLIQAFTNNDADDTTDDEDECDEEEGGGGEKLLGSATTERVAMQPTPYDGVVLAAQCYSDATYRKKHGGEALAQLVLALFMHVLALGIQLSLIFLLLVSAAEPKAAFFRDGVLNRTAVIEKAVSATPPVRLSSDDSAIANCMMMDTLPGAHYLILFLWSTRIMKELNDASWRLLLIYRMDHTLKGERLLEEKDDGRVEIIGSMAWLKFLLVVIVVLPQFACAMFLWWTGSKFLFFTSSMATLIMKAISLSFVTQLDELLFSAFISVSFRTALKKASFVQSQRNQNWHWNVWGSCVVKYLLAILMVSFVYNVTFWRVTDYRLGCQAYFRAFPDTTPGRGTDSLWTSMLKGFDLM